MACTFADVLKGNCPSSDYDPTAQENTGAAVPPPNAPAPGNGGGQGQGTSQTADANGDNGNGVRYVPGPFPGTVAVEKWVPTTDLIGKVTGGSWQLDTITKDPSAPSSSGAQPRNDALTAAQDAISNYLQASSLADARRVAAFDQMQKLSGLALPAGAKDFPGFGPGSADQAFQAAIGMPTYKAPPMTPIQVNPAALANPAPIDPTAQALINKVTAAG